MNDNILIAIESLCDDIATNTNAEENRTRANAILQLAFSDKIICHELNALIRNEFTPEKKIPAAGEHFDYNGIEFVALDAVQGGILAVQVTPLDEDIRFDDDCCNDWRKSTLREYLNEKYIENFNTDDLLPFNSDLTTDSGQKDYGKSEDYVFIISCDMQRKYKDIMPKYDRAIWTLTPWHIFASSASYVRYVYSDGSLDSSIATTQRGVAPACLFNPSIFK